MPAPTRFTMDVPLFQATVATPTVTPHGTAGLVSYGYKIVSVDTDGGTSAASTEGTTSTGNATLSGTNYNIITWTDSPGTNTINIYRTTGGATQGLIGSVAAGVQTFNDTGLVADGSTAPSSNTSGIGTQATVSKNAPYVWFTGTFTATIQVQSSPDGTTWVNMGSAATGDTFVEIPTCVAVRCKMTAYTSGTPAATLLQRQP